MGDRLARKEREQVAPLVPGETVRHAVRAVANAGDGPNQTVVLTDQAVYIMSQKALSGATKGVEERFALGSVPVTIGKGPFWTAMLSVGDRTLRVPVPFKAEAESLVAAVGG